MSDSFSLTRLSAAQTALAEAKTLDDLKHIMGIADAAVAYAKAAKMSIEVQNSGAELAIRAQRLAGEKLAQLERGAGGDRKSNFRSAKFDSEYKAALDESQTTYQQANRWQAIADVPEDKFEKHIEQVKAEAQELTSNGLLRVSQQVKREHRVEAMKEAALLPDARYRVWYADPPWPYGNSGVINDSDSYGRAARHYPSMSIDALCDMGADIRSKCEPDAVLFMWVTSPLLAECFPVIDAWGFQYKSSFVWDKVGHNFGHYNSVRHEFLLVATRGSCLPDDRTLHDSVLSIPKSDVHSQKPEEFRRMIDGLYTWGKRIELFAREQVEGWDAWGNQA